MHDEALQWVAQWATDQPVSVLELGGRDINGTCRPLFPNATYTALDLVPGPGVDVVADAASWIPDQRYDVVVSTEVFEHTELWPQICVTALRACRDGGRFIVTCAGPGRPQHNAHDGERHLRPGEWYRNVEPGELADTLELQGWRNIVVDQHVNDLRATAVR